MLDTTPSDAHYMRAALDEARNAVAMDEVPIGAVAVVHGEIVARAHNRREADGNPLGHAELLLLQRLATSDQRLATSWRLSDVTIYVTCEPCLMCAGAMLQARIPRLVYGCADPKAGACGSLYHVTNDARLNHRIEVIGGCLAGECGALLSDFFRRLRKR